MGGCIPDGQKDATLTGIVYAPNGVIPVSGALVYTTPDPPEAIPQEVYCSECVELNCHQHDTLTDVDGTFTLNTVSGDDRYLVVRKGQFMRVLDLTIEAGDTPLGVDITSLPSENDPDNGLYIPKIAIADGSFDRIEDAMAKFGLGDTMISNFEERLVPDTESFDLWENGRDPNTDGLMSQGAFSTLVQDYELLKQYHVIFIPCSSDTYTDLLNNPQVQDNIKNWVEAGGRWYVADWSNEWMRNVFPQYQDFTLSGNSADLGSYDSLGVVLDEGLLDWLEALPDGLKDINPQNDEPHPTLSQLPKLETVDNWSAISQINPVLVDDGMGGEVDVGHYVWIEGPHNNEGVKPLTVTGQYGCGKIQFTTYHTAEFFNYVGLSPQELVLLYTILEIGVCQIDLPIPM